MKSKLVLEFKNEHEIKRLISLINLGKDTLQIYARTQFGISGFTKEDLQIWLRELLKFKEK